MTQATIPEKLSHYVSQYNQNVLADADGRAQSWSRFFVKLMHDTGFSITLDDQLLCTHIAKNDVENDYPFNPADIDLFEHYYLLPASIQEMVETMGNEAEDADNLYTFCAEYCKTFEAKGYTFDWGLSGEPFSLIPLDCSFPHLMAQAVQDYIELQEGVSAIHINSGLCADFADYVLHHYAVKDSGIVVSIEGINGVQDIEDLLRAIDPPSPPSKVTWAQASIYAEKGLFSHTFLKVVDQYGGLYFDAENTDGVSNPLDLPIFLRAVAEYKDALSLAPSFP
jgi:hypothetical protein